MVKLNRIWNGTIDRAITILPKLKATPRPGAEIGKILDSRDLTNEQKLEALAGIEALLRENLNA